MHDCELPMLKPITAQCEGGDSENMLNNLDFDHIDPSKNFDDDP